jgi:hypothetical protein
MPVRQSIYASQIARHTQAARVRASRRFWSASIAQLGAAHEPNRVVRSRQVVVDLRKRLVVHDRSTARIHYPVTVRKLLVVCIGQAISYSCERPFFQSNLRTAVWCADSILDDVHDMSECPRTCGGPASAHDGTHWLAGQVCARLTSCSTSPSSCRLKRKYTR